jgi:excisionase family DNA binding protein
MPSKPKQARPAKADTLLSIEEVAQHCGVAPSTVRRMVRDGMFPRPERFGRRLRRWSVHKFNAWVGAGCPGLNDENTIQD